MTTQLRDRLDDLLAEVPGHVSADPASAWQAGRVRRTRRRALSVAVAVVLAALVTLSTQVLPRVLTPAPAGEPGGGIGHPARLELPWRTSPLPADVSSPIAGWVRRDETWYAVTPRGALLSRSGIDGRFVPSVSPDGSRVAYMTSGEGPHVLFLSDLVTATGAASPVGTRSERSPGVDYTAQEGAHGFWSPDSRWLVVAVDGRGGEDVDAVVLGIGRQSYPLRAPTARAMLVGWTSDRTVGWLLRNRVVSTSYRTGEVTDVLPLDVRMVPSTASLSPDGRTLAALDADGELRVLDGAGAVVSSASLGDAWVPMCPISWSGSMPWVAMYQLRGDVVLRAHDGRGILADPRLGITCSTWADAALSGPAHEGLRARLLGSNGSWWAWHVREVTLSALLGLTLGSLLRLRRRRAS
jgi:hypothetical protein